VQDVSLYIQLFQVLDKDHLAFFDKKGLEKFRNCFWLFYKFGYCIYFDL